MKIMSVASGGEVGSKITENSQMASTDCTVLAPSFFCSFILHFQVPTTVAWEVFHDRELRWVREDAR